MYPGTTTTVPVTVTTDMAPTAKIVAWFETQKGEIVSDSITFNIADMFKNKVCLHVLVYTEFPFYDSLGNPVLQELTAPKWHVNFIIIQKTLKMNEYSINMTAYLNNSML